MDPLDLGKLVRFGNEVGLFAEKGLVFWFLIDIRSSILNVCSFLIKMISEILELWEGIEDYPVLLIEKLPNNYFRIT